jgi:hypothetical protein
MKKFKPVLLCGNNSKLCAEIIYFLLKDDFSIKTYFSPSEFINPLDTLGNNALIFVFDLKKETKKIVEMFRGIDSPILVLNGENSKDDAIDENIDYLMQNLSANTSVFYNADDIGTYSNIKREEKTIKTCAIQNKGTICASDISNTGSEINFKINYQGKTIPFWARGQYSEDQYYSVLSAILVAMAMGMNLVEISNKLREI